MIKAGRPVRRIPQRSRPNLTWQEKKWRVVIGVGQILEVDFLGLDLGH
jgi:hypothetical protein